MKPTLSLKTTALCLLGTSAALAQSGQEAARLIESPTDAPLNRFRVSCRLGYNISAHLENIGVPASQSFPQPPPPKDPSQHFVSATGVSYRDGYVGIDSTGNAPLPGETQPRTFYWGYASANQIADLDRDGFGDTLLLTHSGSGTLIGDFKNDPQAGLEVSYARQFGAGEDGTTWGIESSFTYTSLDLRSQGIADPRVLAVDGFSLPINPSTGHPIIPPAAPYAGPYELTPPFGAPSIFATPTRYPASIVTSFEASIYGLKVGPYFEFPVSKRLSFALSGGFALLLADTDLRIQQLVSGPGGATASGTLRGSDVGVQPGGYIAGRLSLMASDSVNVFTGLEYESNGIHSQSLGDKRVEIDFWNAVYWTFGVSYSF
jgi:hypothetical protein